MKENAKLNPEISQFRFVVLVLICLGQVKTQKLNKTKYLFSLKVC